MWHALGGEKGSGPSMWGNVQCRCRVDPTRCRLVRCRINRCRCRCRCRLMSAVRVSPNIHPFWAGEHMNSRKEATIDIHCGRCGHKVQVGIVGSHKLLGKQRTFGVLFEGGWKISALNFTSHGWKGWFTRSKGEMPAAQHVWELKLILTCDTLVWEKKLWWWCACNAFQCQSGLQDPPLK